MTTDATNSGLFAVHGGARQILSGDDRSMGEVLKWTNSATFTDANIDGWYSGVGLLTRSGAMVEYDITLGDTDPLASLGAGTFLSGFTSTGTYAFAVYLELLTNSTGIGNGGSASDGVNMHIYYAPSHGGSFTSIVTNPGDCLLQIVQNTSTPVRTGLADYHVYLDGNASVTFKLIALFRNAQYPV